jgi:hypothetical protein
VGEARRVRETAGLLPDWDAAVEGLKKAVLDLGNP